MGCRAYGAPTAGRGRQIIFGIDIPGWAYVWLGGPPGLDERVRSLLRFSLAGTHEAWALPALKRVMRVETFHGALKRSSPA